MTNPVLDASALLAYLQQEPGAERVETLLLEQPCQICAVNLAEVLTRLSDWKIPLEQAETHILALEIVVTPYDQTLARQTAELRIPTRRLGLSLGDRACLALAREQDAVAVTSDRAWLGLDLGIQIECVRPE